MAIASLGLHANMPTAVLCGSAAAAFQHNPLLIAWYIQYACACVSNNFVRELKSFSGQFPASIHTTTFTITVFPAGYGLRLTPN